MGEKGGIRVEKKRSGEHKGKNKDRNKGMESEQEQVE